MNIVIIGAGISGLATAHLLEKAGYTSTIIEQGANPGGAMQTLREDDFLVDFGPNSGLETTPLISEIAKDVGLKEEMIYANEESNTRYILRNGKLMALPTSGPAFISSKLFSLSAKLRLMKEPFIGKSEDGYYQSIADFVRRRLGNEFYDYAIDPFVSGVFAGDPEKLSVKSAFPKLYRLEELYGGLVKGMIRGARERKKNAEKSKQNAKMFSFLYGMQTFPDAIARSLKSKKIYNTSVQKVEKAEAGYKLTIKTGEEIQELSADLIISTSPAIATGKIFGGIDAELKRHLDEIYYPPVMVLYLGYKKSDIKRPLDGFGYLIPSKEKRKFLGAIWSSTIFPNRCAPDKASFTVFVGGARNQELMKKDPNKIIDDAIAEFSEITQVTGKPVYIKHKIWERAIPQYNLGHIEHDRYFEKFESDNAGLFLSGNYRGGISVGDCVKSADVTAKRVIEFIEKK